MASSLGQSALVMVTAELVAQPDAIARLQDEFAGYDVHRQLLERLEERAVELPRGKYSRVHIASGKLSGPVCDSIFASMRSNGEITGDLEASRPILIISGFVQQDANTWVKKDIGSAPVQLKKRSGAAAPRPLRRFAKAGESSSESLSSEAAPPTPPGEENGDDIVDEDELVESFNIKPAIEFPARCDPGPGKKRRRACRDCTCGLKEQEEQEEQDLETSRAAVVLDRDDIAEIDFTVPGKAVGGCGSCALGDAFRCDGCPYIGLPPFKPGQVVSLDQYGDDF